LGKSICAALAEVRIIEMPSAAASVPVQAGTEDVTAQVTVTYGVA